MPTSRRDAGGRPAAARLAKAVFALLALATIAALFIIQELKHQPPLIPPVGQGSTWSHAPAHGVRPLEYSPHEGAIFSFVTTRNDAITVSIVSESSGAFVAYARHWAGGVFPNPIAPIARNVTMHRYLRQHFIWDGRSQSGSLVPGGDYEVQVHFTRLDRTLLIPGLVLNVIR